MSLLCNLTNFRVSQLYQLLGFMPWAHQEVSPLFRQSIDYKGIQRSSIFYTLALLKFAS